MVVVVVVTVAHRRRPPTDHPREQQREEQLGDQASRQCRNLAAAHLAGWGLPAQRPREVEVEVEEPSREEGELEPSREPSKVEPVAEPHMSP